MNLELPLGRPLVEVCVGTVADAVAAAKGGADRLELCSATELGGLTPSIGLIEQVLQSVDLPVMVMIRPRAGGFCYNKSEFATALRDAEHSLKLDVAGIVFGFLQPSGQIDIPRCQEAVQITGQRQTVFHRAFEFVPDALAAIDQLVDLRVTRLLTSGQQPSALAGASMIREISVRASDQLEVMPGGGIRPQNVGQVVQRTGCGQIHIGASKSGCDGSLSSNRMVNFISTVYLEDGRHRMVDDSLVADVISSIGAADQ